ncbi:alpha/beta hydrolase [Epilithonimonas sp. JDS]|uniref:alpha/beta hydrolase n=1 Tax=Epilithonimonas sp. JDS TaxID=2902797 RepID=UPI001E3BE6C9|nr:alpha/beta hydrolase [Epilithonimonas sp. JDS]MCD9854641.1 alpha/beta hydrolase [Epilithonimonas sp. JDS]
MKQILTSLLFSISALLIAQNQMPTPDEVRVSIAKSITDLNVKPESVTFVENKFVDSIPIRIYNPNPRKKLPIIYLVHGAVWVAGDLETHDNICRYLANHTEAIVVAVHYRRAPEYKFPAAFDDSYSVMKWISSNSEKLNSDGKLILIGDSAGGQLVASLCLMNASVEKPIPVTAQVLVDPALDLSNGSDSYSAYGFFIDWYLHKTDNTNDLRISPLLAKDFTKVPKTIIAVAEHDRISDEGERYHKKLLDAGVSSVLYVQPNVGHLGADWCAGSERAFPTMKFVVEELKKVLEE